MTDKNDPREPEPEAPMPRREALRKMGRYATYTAPALLALLATTRQAHAS